MAASNPFLKPQHLQHSTEIIETDGGISGSAQDPP